jgi:hypothetical protein
MRPTASHRRPHLYVVSCLPCHRVAAERPLQPVSASLSIEINKKRVAFAKAVCEVGDLAITHPQPLRRPPALSSLQVPKNQEQNGMRPQCPGNPVFAPRRVILGIPQRLTS